MKLMSCFDRNSLIKMLLCLPYATILRRLFIVYPSGKFQIRVCFLNTYFYFSVFPFSLFDWLAFFGNKYVINQKCWFDCSGSSSIFMDDETIEFIKAWLGALNMLWDVSEIVCIKWHAGHKLCLKCGRIFSHSADISFKNFRSIYYSLKPVIEW